MRRWLTVAAAAAIAAVVLAGDSPSSDTTALEDVRQARALLRSSWGYRETKRRYGTRFPSTLIAGADRALGQAIAKASPPDPPAALTMWSTRGVTVDRASAFGPRDVPGFSWVAAKIAHGGESDATNVSELEQFGWTAGWRARGFKVCGWTRATTNSVRDAAVFVELLMRLGLDCAIADAEDEFMGPPFHGDMTRSRVFVDEMAAFCASHPCAVTTLGAAAAPWQLPFDSRPWIEGGWHLLPQAYPSIVDYYDVVRCAEHWRAAGWPLERIHPKLGVGWSQGAPPWTGAMFVPRLVAAGVVGFSVAWGETSTAADFAALRDAPAR